MKPKIHAPLSDLLVCFLGGGGEGGVVDVSVLRGEMGWGGGDFIP